jgi:hypothetical protein
VGDTVVYRRPEQPDILLFHRVEELRQAPSFRATGVVATMRDAAGDDPPFIIQFGGDVQRVSWYEPHLGGALLALRRLGGDALFIVVALALNASWMWHLVRRIRSRHMAAAPHHPAYGGPSQPRSTLV